jgi:hypothetical protein
LVARYKNAASFFLQFEGCWIFCKQKENFIEETRSAKGLFEQHGMLDYFVNFGLAYSGIKAYEYWKFMNRTAKKTMKLHLTAQNILWQAIDSVAY